MIRKRGFTLIELLIVVAIIAVLITILAPALQTARQMATAAVCQSNQKTLIVAWIDYHQDNKGWLVGGMNYNNWWQKGEFISRDRWVEQPKETPTYAGDPPGGPYNDYVSQEFVKWRHRENGMRAGKLWKYVKNIKAYHCPGDDRYADGGSFNLYQTYSITGTMRGEDLRVGHNGVLAYKKISGIKFPEDKYVFVEEGVKNQWYNAGSWMLLVSDPVNPQTTQWIDPLAIFHNHRSTFSFADGHVILKVYADDRTFDYSEQGIATGGPIEPDNVDLQWLAFGYGGLSYP